MTSNTAVLTVDMVQSALVIAAREMSAAAWHDHATAQWRVVRWGDAEARIAARLAGERLVRALETEAACEAAEAREP